MALSYPENTVLCVGGLFAWPEQPTPYVYWGFPTNFPHTLSLAEAFKWRWDTGSVEYHYRLTDVLADPPVLLDEYTITLEPINLAQVGLDRWILGAELFYSGITPNYDSVFFPLDFAAHCTSPLPAPAYRPDLWTFVLSPYSFATEWLEDNDFSLSITENSLSVSYKSLSGTYFIEKVFTRIPW